MLGILSDLLDSLAPSRTATGVADRQHTLQVATAVLLVEVIRADGEITTGERDAVMEALRSRFDLTSEERAALFELAREKSDHTHDLYTFTAQLNRLLDAAERVRVFEMLWTAAFADGQAQAHEAHLLRRLADLLHISHAQAIGAKLRAGRTGPPQGG
jgi:uncharacterized tellurite resistance protein B-like protein